MTDKKYLDDLTRLGWTRKRLAEELGITPKTLRGYDKNGPPRAIRVAVAALAQGFRI